MIHRKSASNSTSKSTSKSTWQVPVGKQAPLWRESIMGGRLVPEVSDSKGNKSTPAPMLILNLKGAFAQHTFSFPGGVDNLDRARDREEKPGNGEGQVKRSKVEEKQKPSKPDTQIR